MFHKIKAVNALPDYRLSVQFAEGMTKIYDVKPLFAKWGPFKALEKAPELFSSVEVDTGGYGIIWNDNFVLLNVSVIHQCTKTLCRSSNIVRVFGVAGIEDADCAIFRQAAAAVATVFIVNISWPKGKLRCRIINKIFRGRMRPALILVNDPQRIPLEKDMISIAKLRKTIWIVNQAKRHFKVKLIVPVVIERQPLFNSEVDRFLIKMFHVFSSSTMTELTDNY